MKKLFLAACAAIVLFASAAIGPAAADGFTNDLPSIDGGFGAGGGGSGEVADGGGEGDTSDAGPGAAEGHDDGG